MVLDEFSAKVPRVSLWCDASLRIRLFALMPDMSWHVLMTFFVA